MNPTKDQFTQPRVIDPATAKRMLALSGGNRVLRPKSVDAYAQEMLIGNWPLTHQGIAFDINGRLIDGHHRLSAVVKSGVTVTMNVTYNVSPDAALCIDTGRARNMADQLRIPDREAALLNLALRISTKSTVSRVKTRAVQQLLNTRMAAMSTQLLLRNGSARRVYSSAVMRLAAVVRVIEGEDISWVLDTYDSFIKHDSNNLNAIQRSLQAQIARGSVRADGYDHDLLARALKAFDKSYGSIPKMTIAKDELQDAPLRVKEAVEKCLADSGANNLEALVQ